MTPMTLQREVNAREGAVMSCALFERRWHQVPLPVHELRTGVSRVSRDH